TNDPRRHARAARRMAGDGAGAHTTSASILYLTVAVAARNGVMSKRSGAAQEVRAEPGWAGSILDTSFMADCILRRCQEHFALKRRVRFRCHVVAIVDTLD